MKLYKVTIERTTEVVVLADSQQKAEELALSHERDELYNSEEFISCEQILNNEKAPIPVDWVRSLPYGNNPDELTVKQLFQKGLIDDWEEPK